MVASVQGKLLAAELMRQVGRWSLSADTMRQGRDLVRQARAAISDGRLGYSLLAGRRPPAA